MKKSSVVILVVPLLLLALCGCISISEKGGDMNGESGNTAKPTEGLQFIFEDEQYSFQALCAISQIWLTDPMSDLE